MKKSPRSELAAWVQAARTFAGLTQGAFAEKLGVHRTTVADWERGANEPEYKAIQRVFEMFPGAPALPLPTGAPAPVLTDEGTTGPAQSRRMLLLFEALAPAEQELLIDHAIELLAARSREGSR